MSGKSAVKASSNRLGRQDHRPDGQRHEPGDGRRRRRTRVSRDDGAGVWTGGRSRASRSPCRGQGRLSAGCAARLPRRHGRQRRTGHGRMSARHARGQVRRRRLQARRKASRSSAAARRTCGAAIDSNMRKRSGSPIRSCQRSRVAGPSAISEASISMRDRRRGPDRSAANRPVGLEGGHPRLERRWIGRATRCAIRSPRADGRRSPGSSRSTGRCRCAMSHSGYCSTAASCGEDVRGRAGDVDRDLELESDAPCSRWAHRAEPERRSAPEILGRRPVAEDQGPDGPDVVVPAERLGERVEGPLAGHDAQAGSASRLRAQAASSSGAATRRLPSGVFDEIPRDRAQAGPVRPAARLEPHEPAGRRRGRRPSRPGGRPSPIRGSGGRLEADRP